MTTNPPPLTVERVSPLTLRRARLGTYRAANVRTVIDAQRSAYIGTRGVCVTVGADTITIEIDNAWCPVILTHTAALDATADTFHQVSPSTFRPALAEFTATTTRAALDAYGPQITESAPR